MDSSDSYDEQPSTPLAHTDAPNEHAGHTHGDEHGDEPGGHTHPTDPAQLANAVCCRDTVLKINGHAFDLSAQPLTVQFAGFTLKLDYNCADERQPGETKVEKHKGYEFEIRGPDKGDPSKGLAPGRLFINGKHIDYIYDPSEGTVRHGRMFSIHRSLSDLARAFVSANPTLDDSGHHH